MRTSLNEIKLIDDYILNEALTEDKLLFEALLIINPELNNTVLWQKQAHALIKQYGRKKLKAEIEAVHSQLFSSKSHKNFAQKIVALFK